MIDDMKADDETFDVEFVTCDKCGGSGYCSDCIDDLCHGREECIHGDDATCRKCKGEGSLPVERTRP